MTFWKRPRALVLTGLIILTAWVIWRQSRDQAVAGQATVGAWVQSAVRDASADRVRLPAMGETQPILVEALAQWVRETLPESMAADPAVVVEPLGKEFMGGQSPGTHRVSLKLRGKSATIIVVWNGTDAHAIGFERGE